jgi:hypothetical protein
VAEDKYPLNRRIRGPGVFAVQIKFLFRVLQRFGTAFSHATHSQAALPRLQDPDELGPFDPYEAGFCGAYIRLCQMLAGLHSH